LSQQIATPHCLPEQSASAFLRLLGSSTQRGGRMQSCCGNATYQGSKGTRLLCRTHGRLRILALAGGECPQFLGRKIVEPPPGDMSWRFGTAGHTAAMPINRGGDAFRLPLVRQ